MEKLFFSFLAQYGIECFDETSNPFHLPKFIHNNSPSQAIKLPYKPHNYI